MRAGESAFFATYKKELIHTKPWPTLQRVARRDIFCGSRDTTTVADAIPRCSI